MRDLKGNYNLSIKSSNQWAISGTIVFSNVSKLESYTKKLRKDVNSNTDWVIDLNDIELVDSSGLSWILVNMRYAKKNGINLVLVNIKNPGMIRLIDAQGLSKVIK
ncbi:STAS domain-containing protein [Francisellaceae bacterium]|nr:STAS domain-containing protein [Francisellaceae bacterium]